MTSNRKTNSFDNEAKRHCRQGNFDVAVSNPFIFDEEAKAFRGFWCEFMGETGGQTIALLEENRALFGGNGFVGVDHKPATIACHRKKWPNFHWVVGDIRENISELHDYPIAILNLDGYSEVASRGALATFAAIRPIVERNVQRLGSLLLISNNALDSAYRRGQGKTPGSELRAHVEELSEVFSGYATRREVRPFDLLPEGSEKKIDAGFTGTIGAFEVYRGKANGMRMANMRVSL